MYLPNLAAQNTGSKAGSKPPKHTGHVVLAPGGHFKAGGGGGGGGRGGIIGCPYLSNALQEGIVRVRGAGNMTTVKPFANWAAGGAGSGTLCPSIKTMNGPKGCKTKLTLMYFFNAYNILLNDIKCFL